MKTGRYVFQFLIALSVASHPVSASDADTDGARRSLVKGTALKILDRGLGDDGSLVKAKSVFDGASRLYRGEPSISYAWGLVLLRHHQPADATKQFLFSAEAADQSFLPGRQAVAWTLMINRDHAGALEAAAALAIDLATRAAEADSAGEDPGENELASARWLGEFFMAALTAARTDTESKSVNSYLTRIESVFDGPLADAFADGREAFSERLQQLTAEAEAAQERARQRNQRKKETRTGEIKSALENTEAEQADSKLLAGDAKTWLEDTTRKIDRELGRLEKDYQFLSSQDKKLAQVMIDTHKSMRLAEVQQRAETAAYRGLQTQLQNLERDRSTLAAQAFQTAQNGQQLLAAKRAAIQKYEAATGQLVKRTANLESWKQRLSKEQESLANAKSSAPVSRRLKSFRLLLPFDLEVARKQLEATFNAGVSEQ